MAVEWVLKDKLKSISQVMETMRSEIKRWDRKHGKIIWNENSAREKKINYIFKNATDKICLCYIF